MASAEVGDAVYEDCPTTRGGAAVLGSIQPQPLPNEPDGTIALAAIEAAIKPDDFHHARTRLPERDFRPMA